MKRTTLLIIVILVVSLVASWIYFGIRMSAYRAIEMIETSEDAVLVGAEYIEICYPEYHIKEGNYRYFAYRDFTSDDEYNWVVVTGNKENHTSSRGLPMVTFTPYGKLIGIGLQPD